MLAIPMSVFKKNYDWLREYQNVTITFPNNPVPCVKIPIWKADRILSGCGIDAGIIHFKGSTTDSMLFYADVQQYENLKREFISFCGASSTDEEAERLQSELLRTNQVIANMRQKSRTEGINEGDLDRRIRYKDVLEKRLHAIGASEPVSYVGMLNDILIHEDVEFLQINNDNLIIRTKTIAINHENRGYLIGQFSITIPKINSEIKIMNLDRRVNGYHHPHISDTGYPCWGDAKESIKACYRNRNYYGLILLSLCLLNGYYEIGAYEKARIANWA